VSFLLRGVSELTNSPTPNERLGVGWSEIDSAGLKRGKFCPHVLFCIWSWI
jgi:hypothetical protein